MSSAEPTGDDAGALPDGARRAPDGAAGAAPLLAAGGVFEGLLCFEEEARIAGTLRGEVLATGRLVVEAGARVEADILVDELIVAGELRGRAVARRRAEFRGTARVQGRLAAPVLRIEAGAEVHGPCHTGEDARRIAAEAAAEADVLLDSPVLGGAADGSSGA